VDEIVSRFLSEKFIDGCGIEYTPEIARVGGGDKVNDAAKDVVAETLAEKFYIALFPSSRTSALALAAPPPEELAVKREAWLNKLTAKKEQLMNKWDNTLITPENRGAVLDICENVERLDRELRRYMIASANDLNEEEKLRLIAKAYIEDANIVFATLSGAAILQGASLSQTKWSAGEGVSFDTVIIDEAAQATELSCLVPLILGPKKCYLVGDPQQLPATVFSSGSMAMAYGQSLLERLFRGGTSVIMLEQQYRMHPAISSFPRKYFYENKLLDDASVCGSKVEKPYHKDPNAPRFGPYVFIDIKGGGESRSGTSMSISNRAEAEVALHIFQNLSESYSEVEGLFSKDKSRGFGVITPYRQQLRELRQTFRKAGIENDRVEIDTVDGFQGREKDFVVFSCVRTAERGSIGFIKDVRRMNVGITRAKYSMIILGNADALKRDSSDWNALITDAQSRGLLVTISAAPRNPSATLPGQENNGNLSRAKDSNQRERPSRSHAGPVRQVGPPPPPTQYGAPGPPGYEYGQPNPRQYGAAPQRAPLGPPGFHEHHAAPPLSHFGQPHPEHYGQPHPGNYGQPHPEHYGQPHPEHYGQPRPEHYGQPHLEHYGQPRPEHYGQPHPEQYGQPPGVGQPLFIDDRTPSHNMNMTQPFQLQQRLPLQNDPRNMPPRFNEAAPGDLRNRLNAQNGPRPPENRHQHPSTRQPQPLSPPDHNRRRDSNKSRQRPRGSIAKLRQRR